MKLDPLMRDYNDIRGPGWVLSWRNGPLNKDRLCCTNLWGSSLSNPASGKCVECSTLREWVYLPTIQDHPSSFILRQFLPVEIVEMIYDEIRLDIISGMGLDDSDIGSDEY